MTGEGDRVTRRKIRLERRSLETGRPVVVWPGRDGLYVAYDSAQIDRESALEAVTLLVPRDKDSSVEDIAKHGRSR